MSGVHHTDDDVCPLCLVKLKQAHIDLQDWFNKLKKNYPHIHISWSYRGMADQEQAYRDGKSKLHFPHSAHNAAEDGRPCSKAVDLFVIDADGSAKWPKALFAKINGENIEATAGIKWGGTWKDLGDACHFELIS